MALSKQKVAVAGLGLLGLAVWLALLLLSSHAQEPSAPGNDALDRKTWLAVAPGRVEPWSGEIRIGSPAVGRVGDVLVRPNDQVFAGEALLRVEDDEVRSRHAKAEAQVNMRKRARGTPAPPRGAVDRRRLEDLVADSAHAVFLARMAVDEAATARRTGSGNEEALASARKELSEAQEAVRQRQAELIKYDAENSITPNEIDGQLTLARLELRAAEAALENLVIRSPIDGTVLQVNVRAGEIASPSGALPLVVMGNISALRVRAEIDERDFGEIRVGHAVIVRSGAFRGRDMAGKVSLIAPIIEPGRIGARGQRGVTDVNVAEVLIDLLQPGPLAVGMKVDVYFSRESAQR
jgi:HlyD family secretion protein